MSDIEEELLEDLYGWVDQIELSRPKKDMKRDFSDGVLVAEVVNHFCPRLVEMHNYSPANCADLKMKNWQLLSRKVFKRLGFDIGDDVLQNVVECKQWAIEHLLMLLRRKIERHLYEQKRTKDRQDDKPEAEQMLRGPPGRPPLKGTIGTKDPSDGSRSRLLKSKSLQTLPPPLASNYRGSVVPKVLVEEKEQDILMKDETIQILQAKVRRLEHLVHLKEIRIDDLQSQLGRMEVQLKPQPRYKH